MAEEPPHYDDLSSFNSARSQSSPRLIRRASIRSHRSVRSEASATNDGASSHDSFGYRHRRTRSDASAASVLSYTGSEVVTPDDEDAIAFVTEPPKNLVCMICSRVFKDPVITKCGHTFCRLCVINAPPGERCPIHHVTLSKSNFISNLAVLEQIDELYIYCKNGLKPIPGCVGQFEIDPEGCQHQIKLGSRRAHEATCEFMPTRCPNSLACPRVLKKDLAAHLLTCNQHPCPHKMRGCKFSGMTSAVEDHVKTCKYESIKGILLQSDATIVGLKHDIAAKDQEIGFLRSMLAKLSERVGRMERVFEQRIDGLDENLTRVSSDLTESLRATSDLNREVSSIQAKLGLVDDLELVSSTHLYKCKGTFVGHQGPIWALAVHKDSLFSGSSDETIKVWDTGQSFKCRRTLQGHRGIIHTLCIHNHRLYSGSSDHTIKVWDVDTLEELRTLTGHDNPVCTLAAANGMLFSGSLRIIKVWDLRSYECIGQLTGLNHWVRALVATDQFLYAGSYQIISVWSSKREDIVSEDPDFEAHWLQLLETSGGSVYSLCVTERYILCGTYENLIHVWDMETNTEMDTLEGHAGTVYALVYNPMGEASQGRLFSASYDKTIRVWSLETFTCLQALVRHQNSVDALVLQRGRLFSGAADSTVKVWQ